MRMLDLIEKKRDNKALSQEEIKFIIDGYVDGKIPDYQVSALLMAIYFNGMNEEETYYLTDAMLHSGDVIDLSMLPGVKVDKHSTGGVGDKTSLVLGPLAAACGCTMAKLSGRGLGHTGGTLDKLESIPGLTIQLSEERFIKQVQDIHLAIAGQTQNLVPADKKLYALRDVTATVPSLPLIASSIMSKKLAAGSDIICLDVKYGSGAFMKTVEKATELSKIMIKLGKNAGKKVVCFISDMDNPLGKAIGNRIEVKEAVDCLNNKGPKDLEDLCVQVCAYMVEYSGIKDSYEEALEFSYSKLRDGSAYKMFLEFINQQGATTNDFSDSFIEVEEIIPVLSKRSGYLKKIDALTLGLSAMKLGAGREAKEDDIDPNVGIYLNHQVGEYINEGEPVLFLYKNQKWSDEIIDDIYNGIEYSDTEIPEYKVIDSIIE